MRKPAFCSNCTADQHICFRYIESKNPLLSKSEIISLSLSSVAVQPSLCQIWMATTKTGVLPTRLILRCSRMRIGDNVFRHITAKKSNKIISHHRNLSFKQTHFIIDFSCQAFNTSWINVLSSESIGPN